MRKEVLLFHRGENFQFAKGFGIFSTSKNALIVADRKSGFSERGYFKDY